MKKQPEKLENNSIWKESIRIAEYMYEKLTELPEAEDFDTTSKLRHASNDLIFAVSQAVAGEAGPGTNEYEWSNVRKHLFSLKTMYRFAVRQKFISVEPSIMVSLDKLINQIDTELEAARKRNDAQYKKEMKPWLEKYKLWKEMQG